MPTITFDGATKIIDIGYDAATTVVTAADIYSEWKRWVKAGDAQWDEAFALSVGGNDLGGGVSLDGYYFLRNDLGWRIRAADQDHKLIIDGQLFGFASATATVLSRAGRTITYEYQLSSRSQVVNPAADAVQAAALYQEKVYLDPLSAFSGTDVPNGTSTQPVNNLGDAVAIADSLGLRTIFVLGDITINDDVAGMTILAQGRPEVTVIGSANVLKTTFIGMELQGQMDGKAVLTDVEVFGTGLQGVSGHFTDCLIGGVGVTFGGDTSLALCHSYIAGDGAPDFDLNGGAYEIQFRGYSGSLRLKNMVVGSVVSVDVISGRVIIDASCTGGIIKLRGVGEPIEDNAGGAVTLDTDGFLSYSGVVDTLAANIWAAS